MALGTLQIAGLAALVSAGVAGVVGFNLGDGNGYNRAQKKADIVIAAKNADLAVADADFDKCQAANNNYTVAVSAQVQETNRLLREDAARQATAAKKNEAADRRLLDVSLKTAENTEAAREAIRNAVDKCVRANVPADLVGMLNGILAPTQAAPASANPVSRPGGGD